MGLREVSGMILNVDNLLGSLPIANSLGQRVQTNQRAEAKTESRVRRFIRMSMLLVIVAE